MPIYRSDTEAELPRIPSCSWEVTKADLQAVPLIDELGPGW